MSFDPSRWYDKYLCYYNNKSIVWSRAHFDWARHIGMFYLRVRLFALRPNKSSRFYSIQYRLTVKNNPFYRTSIKSDT